MSLETMPRDELLADLARAAKPPRQQIHRGGGGAVEHSAIVGKPGGYHWHYRRGEKACWACLESRRGYEIARYRARREVAT
jgi:hypothetical protein